MEIYQSFQVKNVILKQMKKQSVNQYLIRAQELNITPNFFLNRTYLELSNVNCWEQNEWIWIQDGLWTMFPPLSLNLSDPFETYIPKKINKIWSDFEGFNFWTKYFLDYEYIFDPVKFNDMKGGDWAVFRKNSRKWQRNNVNWEYISDYLNREEAFEFVGNWIERKQDEIEDAELLAKYAIYEPEIDRKFLYNSNNELVAINAWDENWKYINFRICIIKENEPFLSEFARWLFYTDPEIQEKKKFVNDGGTLGNEGLERFKDKMNPVQKRKLYSLIKQ